ncbi:hypothetical protein BDY17DRAFT_326001 [Neohortaea acidophila]|uniref:Uncharacterized protein n=1 Tax=Neohortaea acidophila TaxID=245834 RepID=A0A6A6PML7_9PEZI|nr:uncharacterized protein BDY17DRAFT_326001 [Neohortaea acidophila]KAF2481299.1 hypothetical protein BDY17DRAFT_326001 [Neohortaea acidophila]
MCKTWGIKYSCSHTFYFHLSRCRGTISSRRCAPFTTTKSNSDAFRKPACSATPTLTIYPKSPCGPCQRAELEAASEAKVEDARARAQRGEGGAMDEVTRILDERERLLFCVTRRFPGSQSFKEFRRPENGLRGRELGGSRLRVVVSAADEDEDDVWLDGESYVGAENESRETQAWIDDWAGGWSTPHADPLPGLASTTESEEAEGVKECWNGDSERKEDAKPSIIRDKESVQETKEVDIDLLNSFQFVRLGVMVGS